MRTAKVTAFYKTEAFPAFFAAISASFEDDFQHRRNGHFGARDGHYDSNDHRERKNDGFRAVRELPFSPPPYPRRAYRQIVEDPEALARCRNARNVYLHIVRKKFTTSFGQRPASMSGLAAPFTFLPFYFFPILLRPGPAGQAASMAALPLESRLDKIICQEWCYLHDFQ